MRFTARLAVAAAIGSVLVTAQAMDLPLAGVSQASVDAPALPVVQVHGCHFDMGPGMEPDRSNGPHYHNRECNVVRVGPQGGYGGAPQPRYTAQPPPRYEQPRYEQRRYDDRPRYGYDDGRRRGYGYAPPPRQQVCRERCRYTGPFKKCRTVCD